MGVCPCGEPLPPPKFGQRGRPRKYCEYPCRKILTKRRVVRLLKWAEDPHREMAAALKAWTGRCHACGYEDGTHEVLYRRSLCLDHDHQTGRFRGWLCYECNRSAEAVAALGPERIDQLRRYLLGTSLRDTL